MNFLSLNGSILPSTQPVLLRNNRSYRYGNGVFETIRIKNGQICLREYHFHRLFSSLQLLEFQIPPAIDASYLEDEILRLCNTNKCISSARVRLSFYNGNGNLSEDIEAGFLIEAWELIEDEFGLDHSGIEIGIADGIVKHADRYSHLKTSNFLAYSLAARYAAKNKMDDCLLLNQYGRVADSTIANIFIIADDNIITPSISEGCIDGTMRRHILHELSISGINVLEGTISIAQLESAQEIFLTNAIRRIITVRKFMGTVYSHTKSREIYNRCVRTIEK